MLTAGLNPCYSGICSVRQVGEMLVLERTNSLNPCYSGICSVSDYLTAGKTVSSVLILVIVEYAL